MTIAAAPELVTFFNSATSALRVDLYTLTLASGQVVRWTNATTSVLLPDGRVFSAGPMLSRSRLTFAAGIRVDELHLRIVPRPTDTIGGVPVLRLATLGGLRGCQIMLELAFYDTQGTLKGTLEKFGGQGSPVSIDIGEIDLVAMSELERLNIMMPRDVYQPPCLNTVYDARCGAPRDTFTESGTVTAVATGARSVFTSTLSQSAGYFNLGAVKFTSGANDGQRRTVRAYSGSQFNFALPFPFGIAVGDTFEATAGCDRTQQTCDSKFNNKARFRGQPYIPVPEVMT